MRGDKMDRPVTERDLRLDQPMWRIDVDLGGAHLGERSGGQYEDVAWSGGAPRVVWKGLRQQLQMGGERGGLLNEGYISAAGGQMPDDLFAFGHVIP